MATAVHLGPGGCCTVNAHTSYIGRKAREKKDLHRFVLELHSPPVPSPLVKSPPNSREELTPCGKCSGRCNDTRHAESYYVTHQTNSPQQHIAHTIWKGGAIWSHSSRLATLISRTFSNSMQHNKQFHQVSTH